MWVGTISKWVKQAALVYITNGHTTLYVKQYVGHQKVYYWGEISAKKRSHLEFPILPQLVGGKAAKYSKVADFFICL